MELAYRFRGLVHYHHDGKPGCIQADLVEKELRESTSWSPGGSRSLYHTELVWAQDTCGHPQLLRCCCHSFLCSTEDVSLLFSLWSSPAWVSACEEVVPVPAPSSALRLSRWGFIEVLVGIYYFNQIENLPVIISSTLLSALPSFLIPLWSHFSQITLNGPFSLLPPIPILCLMTQITPQLRFCYCSAQ